MKLTLYSDSAAFSAAAGGFLTAGAESEMHNSVLLGVLRRLLRGEYPDRHMLLATEDDNTPLLAGIMTPPYNLNLSAGDARALPLLVEAAQEFPALPGILGLEAMTETFATLWQEKTGQKSQPGSRLIFYAATAVTMPPPVPGAFRSASAGDHSWLMHWLEQFAIDAGLPAHEQKQNPDILRGMIADNMFFVWEDNGAPASIARAIPVTDNGVRVGSVFTPHELRGRGYASACVGHLTQRMLADGLKWCSLFANTDNPTANRIYQRLGYRERCVYQEYRLTT